MEKLRARTSEEKEIRKNKILTSAKKLFSEFGFQGTKISMITSDADLSPASFYLYFKSKFHIYRALSLQGTSILEKMILQAVSKAKMDSEEKLRSVVQAYFQFFEEEREYYNIVAVLHLGQTGFFTDNDLVPQLEQQSIKLLQMLATILDQGIAEGTFRKMDTWKTAVTLWGMMDGVILMEIRQTTHYVNLDISVLTNHFLEMALSALK